MKGEVRGDWLNFLKVTCRTILFVKKEPKGFLQMNL